MAASHALAQSSIVSDERVTRMSSLAATKQWYLLNHQKTCSLQAPSKSQCLHLSRTIPWCPFRQGTYDNRGHAKGGCRRATVVAPRSSLDDFDFGAGPIEEVRPSFTREAYKIPPPDPPKYIDNPTPKRRSRPKATPAQVSVIKARGIMCFLVSLFQNVTAFMVILGLL